MRLAGNPPAYVVLNGIHPTASRQAADARELVRKTFNLECAPAYLCHRAAYADAMATGRTPQELDEDSLFKFSFELLNNGTGEHVEDRHVASRA